MLPNLILADTSWPAAWGTQTHISATQACQYGRYACNCGVLIGRGQAVFSLQTFFLLRGKMVLVTDPQSEGTQFQCLLAWCLFAE